MQAWRPHAMLGVQAAHEKKIAVFENEFGEVGIDDALLAKNAKMQSEEQIFCVCARCPRSLSAIRPHASQTGMADPAPVAQTFFVDDEVNDRNILLLCTCRAGKQSEWFGLPRLRIHADPDSAMAVSLSGRVLHKGSCGRRRRQKVRCSDSPGTHHENSIFARDTLLHKKYTYWH